MATTVTGRSVPDGAAHNRAGVVQLVELALDGGHAGRAVNVGRVQHLVEQVALLVVVKRTVDDPICDRARLLDYEAHGVAAAFVIRWRVDVQGTELPRAEPLVLAASKLSANSSVADLPPQPAVVMVSATMPTFTNPERNGVARSTQRPHGQSMA